MTERFLTQFEVLFFAETTTAAQNVVGVMMTGIAQTLGIWSCTTRKHMPKVVRTQRGISFLCAPFATT